MKTIKELLELLLDQYQNNPDGNIRCKGLCYAITTIRYHDLIILEEEALLRIYLREKYIKYPNLTGYWWPKCKIKPRVEFLQELISEL